MRSLSTTHEQLLRVLNDDLTNVQTEGGVVVLNLRPLVVQLGDQVAIVGRVAERLPADAGRIEIMDAKQLETAQDVTALLDTLGRFIWFLPLGLAALAIWLAGDRRRSIVRSLAIGAIVAALLVLVARSVAGNYVVDNLVKTESVRPAASDTWDILTALLRDGARTLLGVGIVLLIGVWLVGPWRQGNGSSGALGAVARAPGDRVRRRGARAGAARLVGTDGADPPLAGHRSCSRCCSASASPRWPERRERTRTPWAVQATLPRRLPPPA